MKLFIFILFSINISVAKIIVEEEKPTLADYVNYVYENQTRKTQGYVGLIINDNDNHCVERSLINIHTSQTNSFFLINFNHFDRDIPKINELKNQKIYFGYLKLLIVYLKGLDELDPVFQNLLRLPLYRTRNQLLLVFDKALSIENLAGVFKYCWQKKFLHVIIVFLKNEKKQIYSYNPFWERDRMLENYTLTPYTKNMYYDRLNNINGYNLTFMIIRDDDTTKIITMKKNDEIIYTGLDVEIVQNLADTINGTIKFVNAAFLTDPGERNPWRHTNHPMKHWLQRKQEIIIKNGIDILDAGEMILNDDFSDITESLYPHDKDDLVFILKRGEKIPYCTYLFMIFQTDLWIILFLVLSFVTIIWLCLIRYFKKWSNWNGEWLSILRVIIGVATPQIPISNSERILYISWILYCFIIAISFQSKLTDMLMETKYYPDITTLQELQESGLKILVFRTMQDELYKSLNGTLNEKLINRIVDSDDYFDNINTSLIKPHVDMLKNPLIYSYNRATYATRMLDFCSNERQLLNIIPESPFPRYLAFQVKAGSPYLDRLDKNMKRFKEFGFLKYWNQKWEYYLVLKRQIIPEGYNFNSENNHYSSMTLTHFATAFMILFGGLLFSFIIFFIELLYRNGS